MGLGNYVKEVCGGLYEKLRRVCVAVVDALWMTNIDDVGGKVKKCWDSRDKSSFNRLLMRRMY